MNKAENIEELIALYSLGLLEGSELHEVEEALRTKDEKYLKYFEDVNTIYSNLPYSLDDKPLRSGLKDEIWAEISNHTKALSKEKKVKFSDIFSIFWFKFATVTACLLIGFLVFSNIEIRKELSKKDNEIAMLRSEMSQNEMVKSFIENPSVNIIKLASTESEMNLHARLFWDKEKNSALLCIIDMPYIGGDQTYQFWADSKSDMESIAMFDAKAEVKDMPMSDKMMMINKMPSNSKTMAFYVSIEPKGGMPHPTGKKYLLGKL